MKQVTALVVVAITIAGTACEPPKSDPVVEPDAAPDAPIGPVPTPACAADPAACLYLPGLTEIDTSVGTLADPDRVGGPREIRTAVRTSRLATTPMPIVIWSHGGASGQLDAIGALEQWAIAGAEAGYFSVAIAHSPRDQASREALCAELGFDAAGCATFKFLSYDRPLDIAFVIDMLIQLGTGPLSGLIDPTRIAVGGHSGGAGGTLMVDGAPREINGVSTLMSDPRPVAFLALSPQAPGSDGMTAEGYAQITRPTLIGTGRGDENPPDTADGRASVFDLVQPGNKARIFVEDPAAIHSVFALETTNCASATVTPAHCEAMRDWVKSAGLAFLDAHVRGSATARAWLESSNLAVASGGVAEWSTR